MKIRGKAIAIKNFTLGIASTLSLATILGVGIYSATNIVNNTNNANALSYSTNEDISFTFKPTLSISLSTGALTIDNLVPGTTSDSNAVTVTVSSNTPYGYVLSAGVGSTVSTDPYYNTSDLVHDNPTTQVPTTNKFSSIATSASLPTLDTDNTWGYSTSTDGGTNWSTYSGLSHAETKPLLDISDPAQPSTIDFKIAARSASTQASGTYNNVITFYAVGKPEPPQYLYDEVAKMSKGTQTKADLQTEITIDNSGVYEYNSSEFGVTSDANNNYDVYYYRGILDDAFASSDYYGGIGSSGDGTLFPNYIKLANDTCWRIIRTTGSGGVKMIYNGIWTGSTCANTGQSVMAKQTSFSGVESTSRQKIRVGYTYDSSYAVNANWRAAQSKLFGTNTSDKNTTDSDIKTAVDEWYANTLTSYTDILEPSAGYCGDRSIYDTAGNLQPQSLEMQVAGGRYYYGSYVGNGGVAQAPTLTCGYHSSSGIVVDRSKVDLYSTGLANDGNKKLIYPVALLTADEVNLAGSGVMIDGDPLVEYYSPQSYLRAAYPFWLLSPQNSNSSQNNFAVTSQGFMTYEARFYSVERVIGARPTVSLKSGTEYASGSGTATDPWIIPAP